MSLMETLRESSKGAVLVTTPNLVAIADVRREVTFCQKTGLNIIGLVENMSGFICPNCQVRYCFYKLQLPNLKQMMIYFSLILIVKILILNFVGLQPNLSEWRR